MVNEAKLTPIDPLISCLLSKKPLTDVDRVKLWEALKSLSDHLLKKGAITTTQLADEVTANLTQILVNTVLAETPTDFNDTLPAAPSLKKNIKWQLLTDKVSAYVESLRVNSSVVADPNFLDGTNITFGVAGSNITPVVSLDPAAGRDGHIAGGSNLNPTSAFFYPGDNATTATTGNVVIPAPGWIRHFGAYVSAALAQAVSLQFGLLKNGISQQLSFTMPPGGAAGVYSDLLNTIRVLEGDSLRFTFTKLGNAALPSFVCGWTFEYISDDSDCFVFFSSQVSGTGFAASSTTFVGVCGYITDAAAGREDRIQFPCPFAGTIKKLYIVTVSAQPATGAQTVTIMKNGVAQTLAITIPAGGAIGPYANTSDNFAVALTGTDSDVADLIDIRVGNAATTTGANISSYAVEYVPNSGVSSVVGAVVGATLRIVAGATNYHDALKEPYSGAGGSTTSGRVDCPMPRDGILKNLYIVLSTSVPPTNSAGTEYTIQVGDIDTLLSVSFPADGSGVPINPIPSGVTTYGWNRVNTVSVSRGDIVRLKAINNDGANAGAAIASWACEFAVNP